MKQYPGFSLVELAIAMLLFLTVASLVLVHGSYMYRAVVKQEIEKMAIICRYLQHAAMMSNQPKILIFDRKRNIYTYDNYHEKLSSQVEFGVISGILGPPSNPIRQIQSPITFENERIIFHPDGIIQPGTVYLVSKDKRIMYALSSPVSQVSFMRIYRYDGRWQCLS